MHPSIEEAARAAGFNKDDGTLLLIGEPAEATFAIQAALRTWTSKFPHLRTHSGKGSEESGSYNKEQVDTLVCILTICSIPDPPHTMRSLVSRVLAPGGQLLF